MLFTADHLPQTSASARAEEVAVLQWSAAVPFMTAIQAPVAGKKHAVAAYANHGRWVVECPDCHSAQFGCPDDPRFLCNECANATVGGHWRPVAWPKDRDLLEVVLMARPESARNWQPGEDLAFLQAENKARGVI